MVGKVILKRSGGYDPKLGKAVKDPSLPDLPLEEPKPTPEPKGHGATVTDPRRKHKTDKRKKHGG